MKFYGKPNKKVLRRDVNRLLAKGIIGSRTLFRFDANGEFETEDERLIRKLIHKFKHDAPIVTEEQTTKEHPALACKKCDFTTTNKGELMAHYRKVHPKGESK